MRRLLITLGFLVLIITFGLLYRTWAGFIYFALVFTCLLSIYWLAILIENYIFSFIKIDEEDFKLYSAKLINFHNITQDEIEENKKYYIKKYKKSLWKEKLIELAKIIFILGVFLACLVYMIIYKTP